MASEWMDIESAPKDGRGFLIDAPDTEAGMTMATVEGGRLVSLWDGKPFGRHVTPAKYWRDFPTPPKETPNAG